MTKLIVEKEMLCTEPTGSALTANENKCEWKK